MRYRTASALLVAMIGAMFGSERALEAIVDWHMGRGIPIPPYERVLLSFGSSLTSYRWVLGVLALPAAAVCFLLSMLYQRK